MLLPREQESWNCAYALGAFVLSILNEVHNEKLDVNQLHLYMNRKMERDISINQVVIALSWLYLINKVEITSNGEIKKCI